MEPTTVPHELARPAAAPVAGEQCPACGGPLATDQRYCLNCGERRGDPRLPLMNGRPPSTPQPTATTSAPARRGAGPASTALIAGIGTLLLAMGVGVLIGRSGNDGTTARSPAVQVVSVPGAGAGAANAAATTTPDATTAGASDTAAKTAKKSAVAKAAKPTKLKTVKTPPPTVKLGSPGHGPGYKNGKFTGDFFGG
jgi:hypothetical protein